LFIKNIPAVLILDILITNILMRTMREGMETGGTSTTSTTSTTPPSTTPATDSTDAVPDAKKKAPEAFTTDKPHTKKAHKDETKTKNKKGVADHATPVESFENHERKMKSVNDTIMMLSNVMDKFSGISAKLGFKTNE
jgi:hypothetical protein